MGQGEQNDGYLTDESDFYGSDRTKNQLEARLDQFELPSFTASYFAGGFSLTKAANAEVLRALDEEESIKLSSPYFPRDGDLSCRQSTETVDEFLVRLPPRSTETADGFHWIWITNPIRQIQPSEIAQPEDLSAEEGLVARKDISRFITAAQKVLDEATIELDEIEESHAGKPAGKKSKALTTMRQRVESMIKKTALDCEVKFGKWMLFVDPADVNEVWGRVAHAVTNNTLGPIAKVAPKESDFDREARLICIYTRDFSDLTDVKRVVEKIDQLGLIGGKRGMGIYYKCDAYTHLGITSKNQYKIKASLYSSKDFLGVSDADLKRKFADADDTYTLDNAFKKVAK